MNQAPVQAHLAIQNVSAFYRQKRNLTQLTALRDISFSVQPGEFVAIVGPSGCGKSTLLNLIAGIQPIEQGSILLNGKVIGGASRERAMVFQAPALLPWRTVLSNVSYGLELQGTPKLEAQAKAQHFVALVGLAGFEESYPNELSGGMQQRVNLARALSVEPTILLMDEPLSALDAILRETMQEEIQRIWQQAKQSVLYVTHQIDEAVFLANRVIVMAAQPGRIRKEVTIPFPHPRNLAIKRQFTFSQICDEIWQVLQANV